MTAALIFFVLAEFKSIFNVLLGIRLAQESAKRTEETVHSQQSESKCVVAQIFDEKPKTDNP